jgi:hypothetical protein
MGLAHIIFNKSNKTLWSITLSVVWFNIVRDFDWMLTQLIWLKIIHLNWEAEKRTSECHTRARAAAAGQAGAWVWAWAWQAGRQAREWADGATGEQVPPQPSSAYKLAQGVQRLGFWGTISRLLIHAADIFFLVITHETERHLLPSDRSWDCTVNTFLHRLWSTTSSNALCLVRMEHAMPSAWDPSLGTLLTLWLPYFAYLLYRSVCHTCML